MPAVWVRARAELRSGWRRAAGLVLLIGLVGGAAIAAAAGARRTDSALARFNRAQRAADVLYLDDGSGSPFSADFVEEVARLPMVRTVARARYSYVLGNDGLLAPADSALGTAVDRRKILHGRAPRPDHAEEVAVSFDSAKRHGLHVGSAFTIVDPSYPDAIQFVKDHPEAQLRLRVTEISAAPGGLPPYQLGMVAVVGTPSLYRFLAAHEGISAVQGHHVLGPTPDSLVVRLRRGDADGPAFRKALRSFTGRAPVSFAGQSAVSLTTADVLDGNARSSMHLQSRALWLLAAVVGFSALLVFGQTLGRFIALQSNEGADLRALGMTAGQLWAVSIARMALLGASAAAVAVVAAVAASPLTPLGLAGTIEPSPGVSFDGAAIGLGALGVVLFVLLLSLYPAWHAARARAIAASTAERPSVLATTFARAGMPPAVVTGARMALEQGRGRTAVPVRSTIVGATAGIAALVTALTFGTSLAHLLATPRLYGVSWDARLTNYGGHGAPGDPDLSHVAGTASAQPGVAAVSAATFGQFEVGGRATGYAVMRGPLRPPVLAGRYPSGPEDAALGARTMRRLHAGLGSDVTLHNLSGQTVAMRVVGKTVLPADGDPRLGEGVVLSASGLERAVHSTGTPATADSLLVRLAPGSRRSAVIEGVQQAIAARAGLLDAVPPQKPTDLVNFGGVKSLPFVLAGILAVVAVATLAHLLVSAVRRRRRDLAILKTIGFVRGQVTATVAWQATTLVAVALLVGLPVGVGVGRSLWAWFATQQGVVSEARVPLSAIVLVVPAAIVLANLVAALPARAAGLTRPALVLRTE